MVLIIGGIEYHELKTYLDGNLEEDNTLADLSGAALSWDTSLSASKFKLKAITIGFSAAVSPTVTISLVSNKGTGYAAIINRKVLVAETSYYYAPADSEEFAAGDQIRVEITSVAATAYVIVRKGNLTRS